MTAHAGHEIIGSVTAGRSDSVRAGRADRLAPLALLGLAAFAAYVLTAQIGFRVAFAAEQVTTVWAPSGIALATLLLFGLKVSPVIWLAAFVVNASTTAPIWTAFVIATGNTFEAVSTVWVLRRLPRFDLRLARVADAFAFMGVVSVCTVGAAVVGAAALCAASVQPWARFPALWFDWWLGDVLGALIVAPAILTTLTRSWSRRDSFFTALAAGAIIVTHLVFGGWTGLDAHPLEYVIFPMIIIAAVTGGTSATSLLVLGVSATTIWHTVHGTGPFRSPDTHDALIQLQVFMGVLAATGLLLAAAVSERKASEQRERDAATVLKRREEMLTLGQKAGGVATFEWDFVKQVATCSAEFFRIFGLPPGDGLITSAEWGSFVHPDDRAHMAEHLSRAVAGAEPASTDYRIITADGTTRWLSYAGQLQTTPEGLRMLGTVVDISDRKRLEEELRRHAAEVERILETVGEGFVTLDAQFRYTYVNRSAEQMLQRSRPELLGRTPWEVFPFEAVRASRQYLEQALATGEMTSFDVRVAEWNRWYETRVYPSDQGLSIFFADITARVASEAALRESRDVLALAMRGGSMGAWSRDLITDDVWWSRELEEIFGLEPGAFNRTHQGFYEFVHAEDWDRLRAAVNAAVQSRHDYIVEFRFRHASGEWRWMEGRGRATYDDAGTPRRLYGIGVDVTERKQAEIALRDAKSAAEDANRLKDQFLATLSHELRTPLNAILGYAQMLKTGSIAPEKRHKAVDVIERNAMAQKQLVEDLLDMSRITTGRLRLDPQPLPVARVLLDAIDAVRPAADAKGISVTVAIDPSAGLVVADPTRLRQVFWNLLSNAIKFTEQRGRVGVSVCLEGGYVETIVTDTGAGISPDFLPFVFEPFRQADTRFAQAQGGLGLGLAISKQLIELHGGTVQATSAGVGSGATFTVRLPAAAPGSFPAA